MRNKFNEWLERAKLHICYFSQIVQAELEEIGEVWKQARFDSLPHVVGILTSQVPEDAIQSLRQQRDDIEDIVDDVVKGYHDGFNKAFHNYSQVCLLFPSENLFGKIKGSLKTLKINL